MLRGEVELHKQPRLPVGVAHTDSHNDGIAEADVHHSRRGDPSRPSPLRTSLRSSASIVHGHRDGETVIQSGDGNVGSVFRAELHGRNLGGDGVVGHVVEGERVGLHLEGKAKC